MANPLKILLVDDHADTTRMVARMLHSDGHSVRTAATAADAITLCAAEPFNVVVTDIGLPDMGGDELMRELQQRHGVIGIAITGHEPNDMTKGEFVAYLRKPIEFADLQQILNGITP